jgi:hypothetical protein
MALLIGCTTHKTTRCTVSRHVLRLELANLNTSKTVLDPLDNHYESFAYTNWLKWLPTPPGTALIARADAWDCEDYALEAMYLTKKLFRDSCKTESTPAIGVAVGMKSERFLGVQGKGRHALNVIHTQDFGWMFYEPQTGRSARVKEATQEKMFSIEWILF